MPGSDRKIVLALALGMIIVCVLVCFCVVKWEMEYHGGQCAGVEEEIVCDGVWQGEV